MAQVVMCGHPNRRYHEPIMQFLLLAGSFHSRSYTHALLDVVTTILAQHRCVRPALDRLPFYSEDLSSNKPQPVLELLDHVRQSDGLIICSPEYNHSIPAVLKNALDWASRPAFKSPLKDKPVTIITQAHSPVGGARAQAHIKLVLDSTLSLIHPAHEMMVTEVKDIFDAQMQLTDARTRERLQRHIGDFLAWQARVAALPVHG
jgi:chromate reductase